MHNEYFIGDPGSQMDDWIYQNRPDNCAVAAETSIINQFIDGGISLNDASYISASNGWYQPGMGTDPSEIGNLMDMHGIPNHTVMDATIEQLTSELQQGNGVIVGVNSSELWDQGMLNEFKQFLIKGLGLDTADFNPADHAVAVTGIDFSDPENPQVIINDSGISHGAANRYPLAHFLDAWENSGFYYTATDSPIPDQQSPSELGFDLGDLLGKVLPIVAPILIEMTIDTITETDWEQLLA